MEFDQAGAHRADFEAFLEGYGVNPAPIPRDAHWKLGVAESRIQSIKFAAEKTMEMKLVDTREKLTTLIIQPNEAPSKLGFVKGFSLEQWVLGKHPNLPLSTREGPANLTGHQDILERPVGPSQL